MASKSSVCPVVGTTTNVLPPNHPPADTFASDAVCPVTNAKAGHHDQIIHNHPTDSTIPDDSDLARDARACPALQHANDGSKVTHATCPVVGPVNTVLPPGHPSLPADGSDKVCPKTNATMQHHQNAVHVHPAVPNGASIKECPVVGNATA